MLAARLISLCLFGALAFHAVLLSAENAQLAPLRAMSSRLELGKTVRPEMISAGATRVMKSLPLFRCRSGLMRPGLSIVLHNLALTNQSVDMERWASAHEAAQTYIQAMIRCLPADGNLWFRDAVVARAIAEDPVDLAEKMKLSQRYMPYEDRMVLARLFLWKGLSSLALARAEQAARADIRAILTYGSDSMKKALAQHMSPQFTALWRSEVARTTIDVRLWRPPS